MASAAKRAIPDSTLGSVEWFPDWRGDLCAIIASGPSAKAAPIGLLDDGSAHAIAVNESWRLCPWADVLYGCDAKWWKWRGGVPEYHGMKVSQDPEACRAYPEIRKIDIVDVNSNELELEPGRIGAGGNSGFQALNLAVQFGAAAILLIGFDMRVDLGEHWHPRHYPPLSNPHATDNLPRWRSALDGAAGVLERLGVKVFNCSAVSTLRAYPKMTIEEALWASRST